MVELIRRDFIVDAPLASAWEFLAKVERWPSWAPHIKKIQLLPSGALTLHSRGIIHLTSGIKSEFRMTELNVSRNWKWAGQFLWLTVHYDHQFEAVDNEHTRLIWIVQADGFGATVFGKAFALMYRRNLDRAIPLLIAKMKDQNRER